MNTATSAFITHDVTQYSLQKQTQLNKGTEEARAPNGPAVPAEGNSVAQGAPQQRAAEQAQGSLLWGCGVEYLGPCLYCHAHSHHILLGGVKDENVWDIETRFYVCDGIAG